MEPSGRPRPPRPRGQRLLLQELDRPLEHRRTAALTGCGDLGVLQQGLEVLAPVLAVQMSWKVAFSASVRCLNESWDAAIRVWKMPVFNWLLTMYSRTKCWMGAEAPMRESPQPLLHPHPEGHLGEAPAGARPGRALAERPGAIGQHLGQGGGEAVLPQLGHVLGACSSKHLAHRGVGQPGHGHLGHGGHVQQGQEGVVSQGGEAGHRAPGSVGPHEGPEVVGPGHEGQQGVLQPVGRRHVDVLALRAPGSARPPRCSSRCRRDR